MIVHEVFAQIFEGEVKNIMVCDNYPMADYLTKCTYGLEAFAVDCLQYPCGMGDRYHDGFFWRVDQDTGEEAMIEYVPTQEQQVQTLQAEKDELTLAMAELIGGGVYAE